MLLESITGCYNFQSRHQDTIGIKYKIRLLYGKICNDNLGISDS